MGLDAPALEEIGMAGDILFQGSRPEAGHDVPGSAKRRKKGDEKMASSKKKAGTPNYVLVVLGAGMLVAGITLVLVWWPYVLALFKGVIGMVLAVAGLVALYLLKD